MRERIEVGHLTFLADGEQAFGAVREIAPGGRPELIVYVENGGDFAVPLAAVTAVHAHKVILDIGQLTPELREAISHAHDAEEPGM